MMCVKPLHYSRKAATGWADTDANHKHAMGKGHRFEKINITDDVITISLITQRILKNKTKMNLKVKLFINRDECSGPDAAGQAGAARLSTPFRLCLYVGLLVKSPTNVPNCAPAQEE